MDLKILTDKALVEWTRSKVAEERKLQDQVLAGLYEIETRKLFSDFKCSSLFDFCTRILGYSEGAAQRRIDAMRLLKSLPSSQRQEIRKKVRSGNLKLNQVAKVQSFVRKQNKVAKLHQNLPVKDNNALTLLSRDRGDQNLLVPKIITTEEKIQILEQVSGKTGRQTDEILLNRMSQEVKVENLEKVRVISDELTELRFAADKSLMQQLTRLRGLLAHSHPHISMTELVKLMASNLIQTVEKKRFGVPTKRTEKKAIKLTNEGAHRHSGSEKNEDCRDSKVKPALKPHSRRVPTEIRRKAFDQTKGRCEKCGSVHALELDHRIPFAAGGDTEEENIRLLCRSCNQRAAVKFYGMRSRPR